MKSDCQKIKDQIADLVTGILPEAQVHELEQHLNECAACRDYARALKDEDMLLTEFFAKIDTNITHQQERVLQAINHSGVSKQSETHLIWRIIMKSPITKLAAAAVIIIACLTGLFFWRSTGSGIALADVLTRIEQVTAYMYQMRSTLTRKGTSKNLMRTVLISQDHGVKTITKGIDPITGKITRQEKYYLPRKNSQIRVNHDKKTYLCMKFEDATSENNKEEDNDPRTIIKQFLSCEHTSLGQSVIDGITVEGFQTTDLAYKGGFREQADFFMVRPEKVDVKIWVDVNTFLPLRSEEDIVTKNGTRRHDVSYDFRWNVVVDASDFEPNIPENYTSPTGDITFPAFTEESAIKGLRLFADLARHYPANPSGKNFIEQARELIGYDANSWKDLPDNEKTRRNNDILRPIVGFAVFYKILVDDKKKPVYYGETVGPDDTNKVLLRWKLDDDQYRVIYGDLSIKNVTPEKLAELEKP